MFMFMSIRSLIIVSFEVKIGLVGFDVIYPQSQLQFRLPISPNLHYGNVKEKFGISLTLRFHPFVQRQMSFCTNKVCSLVDRKSVV